MKSRIADQYNRNSKNSKTRGKLLATGSLILSGGGNSDAGETKTPTGAHFFARVIVFCSLMGLGTALHAATLYVSKEGSDLNPCSRAAPCLTIQHAVYQSRKSGRIVVGPGIYDGDILIHRNERNEELSGLKLESTTGMWATFIEGGTYGLRIFQPRVRLGKKGKGFTIQSASESGVLVSIGGGVGVSGVIIEGNRMLDNRRGIYLPIYSNSYNNEKIQIKNNMLIRNSESGLLCTGCYRALIRENQAVENTAAGFTIALSNRISVTRNTAIENGSTGFYFQASEDLSFTRNIASFNEMAGLHLQGIGNTGASIKDNVFDKNQMMGIETDNADGYLIQGNILGQNGSLGLEFNQITTEKPTQIRNNLAVGGTFGYLLRTGTTEARFESNTAVSVRGNSVTIYDDTTFSKFSRNNTINSRGCGLALDGASSIKYDNQYFGGEGGSTTCGTGTIDPTSTESSKPNALKVNIAKSL